MNKKLHGSRNLDNRILSEHCCCQLSSRLFDDAAFAVAAAYGPRNMNIYKSFSAIAGTPWAWPRRRLRPLGRRMPTIYVANGVLVGVAGRRGHVLSPYSAALIFRRRRRDLQTSRCRDVANHLVDENHR